MYAKYIVHRKVITGGMGVSIYRHFDNILLLQRLNCKYISKFRQIYFLIWTNTFQNLNKYMHMKSN